MDKTHNISLGGFAFSIEDAAYMILNRYLKEIRISISNVADAEEIMADVEFRMAELLREHMQGREVVNHADIQYLTSVMGEPKDFYSEEFVEEEPAPNSQRTYASYARTSKKLYRDPDDKFIGGVCAGLGHYMGIDATWVRILFVAAMFIDPIFFSMASMVFVGYIVLWLVVPEAKTTSDKLQMRGEPVNVDSIKDFFDNSSHNLKSHINDVGGDARRVASSSGSVIGNILRFCLKIIGIFFLIIMVIIALAMLIAFVALVLGLGSAFFGVGITTVGLNEYLPYVFEHTWEKVFLYISLFLVLVIPAVALILLVLRIISKRYSVPRFVGFGLPLLWFFGLVGLTMIIGLGLRNFSKTDAEIKTVNIPTNAKTIVLQIDEEFENFDSNELLDMRDGYLTFPNQDDVTVRKSTTGVNYLELKYIAKGKDKNAAKKALDGIEFKYSVKDSIVHLDEFIQLKEGMQWRNQKVEPILYLTDSTQVVFRNFDDGEAYVNGYKEWFDADSENIYIFDDENFKCLNCENNIDISVQQDSLGNNEFEPENINIQANQDSINIQIK